MLTSFQVAGTNGAYNLYFYTLIIGGNWMLLNLFVAILVQGFAEQRLQQLQENLIRVHEAILKELGGLEEEHLSKKLTDLFGLMDKDRSGFIDRYELQFGLATLGIRFRPKDLADIVNKYDKDGSGSIDFDE